MPASSVILTELADARLKTILYFTTYRSAPRERPLIELHRLGFAHRALGRGHGPLARARLAGAPGGQHALVRRGAAFPGAASASAGFTGAGRIPDLFLNKNSLILYVFEETH